MICAHNATGGCEVPDHGVAARIQCSFKGIEILAFPRCLHIDFVRIRGPRQPRLKLRNACSS